MLGEVEIKNWRDLEVNRLSCIVDPVELRCHRIAIAVLDGVLND